MRSGRIVGMEALLRWQSPELGLVPPLQFIPVAEESNLINAIGMWVLDKACATLRAWLDAGLPVVPIAVNVAASQFSDQGMDQLVRATLERHGVEPRLLELELTESLSMENPEASIELMRRLNATGIGMSIDDFGTGYSNLSYLKRFPVHKLKIDQSFTRGLTSDPEDRSIVTAVIRMAHSLGLCAIAEGVETEGQLRVLAAEGCDEIQGYYFSRPLPEQAMVAMLERGLRMDLAPLAPSVRRRTVLLVDDEPQVLSTFRKVLDGRGYDVMTAHGVAEAYELLAGHEVGVVISDQELLGHTGIDFFQRIKRMYPRTVRVLMTADISPANLADAINKGAIYKFVAKPWQDEAMVALLASAFAHYERL
ncbi:EAL domain-containing protein [Massilia cavernae]|uniref:EAL domain-containing protein n=1 Tax=Massilia cavernae TaxID=2320864 RepID=UPI001E62431D|nr:EAL domain-containing protein [Massilia cavernae]